MKSSKYGGLERFLIELAKQSSEKNIRLIFVYEVMPMSEEYIQDLEMYNVTVLVIPSIGTKNSLKFLMSLIKLFYRIQPLLVHFHFTPAGYLGLIPSVLFRIKRVRTIHSQLTYGAANDKIVTDIEQLKLKTRLLIRFMYCYSNKIFPVSEAINSQFQKIFRIEKKLKTLYLGVKPIIYDKLKSRIKYNLPENKIIITCTAFHESIKGIDILLDAIYILKENFNAKDFKICQIGAGNQTKYLYKKASDLNIQEDIIWLGLQKNVPEILSASDIYTQPSRSEGIPLALMEACFAKLPIVATNIGGIPEVVVKNVNGFLVESENSFQLAKKLFELISNPALRIKLGNAAFAHAYKNFDVNLQVKKLISEYSNYIFEIEK